MLQRKSRSISSETISRSSDLGRGVVCESESHVNREISRLSTPMNAFGQALSKEVKQWALKDVDSKTARTSESPPLSTSLVSWLGKMNNYKVKVNVICSSALQTSSQAPQANFFRNLRHEFLLVRGQGEYEGLEYVVDLAFRDQFEIPQPTPGYQELLKAVPQVFVGTMSSLVSIVKLLGREIGLSFEEKGLALPPWRHTDSLLTKWSLASVQDIDKQRGQSVLKSLPMMSRSSMDSSWVSCNTDNDTLTGTHQEPLTLISSFDFVISENVSQASSLVASSSQPLPESNDTHYPRRKLCPTQGLLSHMNPSRAASLQPECTTKSFECSVYDPVVPGLPRIYTVRPRYLAASAAAPIKQRSILGSVEYTTSNSIVNRSSSTVI
jgi:uncharacterized protein (TIGR01615 family)